MKMISKLHLVTDDLDVARSACAAGADWIQARFKDLSEREWLHRASQMVDVCREFGATCIVNDSVSVALECGADGVHLGKEDLNPVEARKLLGTDEIIGGTANTFEDIERLVASGVDYIGLGPLRYTFTKKKLSPILGLIGVEHIIQQMRDRGFLTPVVVIGGVAPSDLDVLEEFGVHGVAVSSAIAKASDVGSATKSFLRCEARLI